MVKKVIMKLDLSKVSGSDCITVVVLQNCEPELSYMPATLFNKCLKESFFSIVGQFYGSSLGKGLQLKANALLVFFLWIRRSLKNL